MASASENQPEQLATRLPGAQAGVQARSLRAGQRRLPSWLSLVLIALTCVCLLASTVTIWAEATVLNTDRFVALAAPLGHDPQVINSVSHYVADQVVTALDIPSRTAAVLPASGQFLVGPLEQSVHDFVQTRASALLSSDQMQATWQVVGRSVHAELVAARRGQSSSVAIVNGTLSIDLLPLIAATLSRLQQVAPGLIASGATIPNLTGAQSPTQARQQLSQALGVQLPPDFGVVTVLHSDALTTAQRIVTALDTLQIVLPIVTVVLAAVAVWSIADWRRALLLLGIGTVVVAAVTILLIQILVGQLTASVLTTPAHEIVQALVGLMWASLLGLLLGVVVAGALVAFGAYLAGMPGWLARLLPGVGGTRDAGMTEVPPSAV